MVEPRAEVVVLGAGVTGLTAAYRLLEAGCAVTVCEAAPAEGGLAATFRRDGFAFDFGPHEFCTDQPALVELLEKVCGDDLLVVDKRAAQLFRGRLVHYPFRVIDVLQSVGPRLCARALGEVAWLRLKRLFREPDTGSFERWTRSRFGSTLYDIYFGPYTRKVWGVDPDQLDHVTASDRISVDSLRTLVRKTVRYHLLGREDLDGTHGEFQRRFFYARGGIGTLQRRLRERVEALGARLLFDRRLVAAARDGNHVRQLRFADGSVIDRCDRIVSTIPLPAMVRIALGEPAEPLLAANTLPFRGMVFVFVRVDRPKVSDYHWIYFPDPDVPFQRATEFSHFGAGMSPPGQTGLTLEVAADPGDGVWELSDAAVFDRCAASLENLGLLERGHILGYDVVRVRHGYPKQVRGFLLRSRELLAALADGAANVVSIGRQGMFRYCNMNECMEMAIEVAPRVAAREDGIRFGGDRRWQGVGLDM